MKNRRRSTLIKGVEGNMFISEPHKGDYYIAEPSRKGTRKVRWSRMPVETAAPDIRIDPSDVPYSIKRQAYRIFYRNRKELK